MSYSIHDINAGAGATQIIQVGSGELKLSFFKTSPYESYKNINPEREPGTCRWFLEHATFQEWSRNSCHSLLWLSADPGCGKSVLSRALIDEKLFDTEPTTICYFFFKDNPDQDNVTTALCALLHQILWKHNHLHKHVAPAHEKCGKQLKNDFDELWRTFMSVATDPSAGKIVCIMDALDECKEIDRNMLIDRLIEFHRRFSDEAKQAPNLKFLVTSRPYYDIEREFSSLSHHFSTIRVAGEEESDTISSEIASILEIKVERVATRCRLNDLVRTSLLDKLREIPNRTYLWLYLTLAAVEIQMGKGATVKRMLRAIENLPSKVEEAYEEILSKGDSDEARKTLQIIVAARRPLTISEIDVALELEPDSTSYNDLDCQGDEVRKRSIRENCGLFVSIVDSRVYLIHQTAREFLLAKPSTNLANTQGWKHSISLEVANHLLAEKCVTYLLLHEIRDIPYRDYKEALSDYMFLVYAAQYSTAHVEESCADGDRWLSKVAKLCDLGNGRSQTWFVIWKQGNFGRNRYYDPSSLRPTLYWAVVLGLVQVTRYLLNSGTLSYMYDDDLEEIFEAALRNEEVGVTLTEMLLDHQELDIKITKDVLVNAINNYTCGKDILALLFDRRGDEIRISDRVLREAYWVWRSDPEVMLFLLQQRVECFHSTANLALWIFRGIGGILERNYREQMVNFSKDGIILTEGMIRDELQQYPIGAHILKEYPEELALVFSWFIDYDNQKSKILISFGESTRIYATPDWA